MREITCLILLLFIPGFIFAQKVIEGRSTAKKISIEPKYEIGFPPSLFVALSFEDTNGNGIIESEYNAELKLTISNKKMQTHI